MAKASADKVKGVPNRHLHARIAFLHQAATHLALHRPPIARSESTDANVGLQQHGLPLLLAAQLKAVSLKAQIRLSHDVKRSICKVCSTPLMPDTTSETRIENMSRASKKPHAELLVIRCRNCQTEKRFPIGATRQKTKAERKAAAATAAVSIKGQEIEVEMKDA